MLWVECGEHWKDMTNYFIKQGWKITSDFDENIFLRGPALK